MRIATMGVTFSLLIVGLFATSCSAQQALSGASGPRIEKIAAPPSPNEIDDTFVVIDYNPFGEGAPQYQQRFPSGTKALKCVVIFKTTPPDGTKWTCDTRGSSGKVEGSGTWMQVGNRNKPGLKVWTDLEPKGGFADGAYQAVIAINGVAVYYLNWSIGSN